MKPLTSAPFQNWNHDDLSQSVVPQVMVKPQRLPGVEFHRTAGSTNFRCRDNPDGLREALRWEDIYKQYLQTISIIDIIYIYMIYDIYIYI